jgi:hypothetical protein
VLPHLEFWLHYEDCAAEAARLHFEARR